jgi:acetoin utilization deacetylase AcuC-like enzyme
LQILVARQPELRDSLSWTLNRDGKRTVALEVSARTAEIEAGLAESPGTQMVDCDTPPEVVQEVLETIHDGDYLDFLERASREATVERPVLSAGWSAPGVPADTPVGVGSAEAARSAVATALMAARLVRDGARAAYGLCRPPGHHAGPGWAGGYCYLNNAAAAVSYLRRETEATIGILDVDFHLGNGTAAIVDEMEEVWLESLHGSTVEHFPWRESEPRGLRQRFQEFSDPPSLVSYLGALDRGLERLSSGCEVLVVSLGYDIVAGDPHGSWSLPPMVFAEIGARLRATELPICLIQEGGYSVDQLRRCANGLAGGLTTYRSRVRTDLHRLLSPMSGR